MKKCLKKIMFRSSPGAVARGFGLCLPWQRAVKMVELRRVASVKNSEDLRASTSGPQECPERFPAL